jgi:SAM-dependent methyltransferase
MRAPPFDLIAAIEEQHWWYTARRNIVHSLIHAVVPNGPPLTILDIGCGNGGTSIPFHENYRYYGIDPSPQAIQLAQERHWGVPFLCGQAPGDCADILRGADVVLLMDVLEHIEDDQKFLSSIIEEMGEGALLLLTVPADPSLWSPYDVSAGHYRRYDERSFRQLWEDLPVRPLLLSYFNARLSWIIRLVRSLHQHLGGSSCEARRELRLPPGPLNALLRWIFEGEGRILRATLEGARPRGYRSGVSLLGLLQRRA